MVIIDSETQASGTESGKSRKDLSQDAKIASLQTAVESLTLQVTELRSTLTELNESIEDKYSAQTQTLMSALASQINALSQSLGTSIQTGQVSASIGNFERLAATLSATLLNLATDILTVTQKAEITEAEIADSKVTNETVENLRAASAEITEATITLLNVASFAASRIMADFIRADDISAGTVTADEIDSALTKARNITGKEWQIPIGTPDNTELLHISIPKYKGVVQIQTQDDEFSVTVLNDSAVALNQTGDFIYRVERNENTIDLYLQNVGEQINYRLLYVGSESYAQSTSEIVDKTYYEQNVTEKEDMVFFYEDMAIGEKELSYLKGLRGGIQEQIDRKQDKDLAVPVEINGEEFTTVESALQKMASVLNGMLTDDIIYINETEELIFPYNSILYDNEELTVSGFNVQVIGEEITFSRN